MVIDKLQNAIVSTYTGATSLVSATSGGIHYDTAPEGQTGDYIVYEIPDSGELDQAYNGSQSSDALVIFRVIATGNGTTSGRQKGITIMGLLLTAFNTTLSLTGGTNFSMYQVSEPVGIPLPADQNKQDVHQWSVPFNYSIE
jgi:hypothetical protein